MLRLFANREDHHTFPILIAAEYACADVFLPDFDPQSSQFLQISPLGTLPALETEEGVLFEGLSIGKYIASFGFGEGALLGSTTFESAQIDCWVEFCTRHIDAPATQLYNAAAGIAVYDAEVDAAARDKLSRSLAVMEDKLKATAFLAGSRVTLADVCVYSALLNGFKLALGPAYRQSFPNVQRWLMRVGDLPSFRSICGRPTLAADDYRPPVYDSEENSEAGYEEDEDAVNIRPSASYEVGEEEVEEADLAFMFESMDRSVIKHVVSTLIATIEFNEHVVSMRQLSLLQREAQLGQSLDEAEEVMAQREASFLRAQQETQLAAEQRQAELDRAQRDLEQGAAQREAAFMQDVVARLIAAIENEEYVEEVGLYSGPPRAAPAAAPTGTEESAAAGETDQHILEGGDEQQQQAALELETSLSETTVSEPAAVDALLSATTTPLRKPPRRGSMTPTPASLDNSLDPETEHTAGLPTPSRAALYEAVEQHTPSALLSSASPLPGNGVSTKAVTPARFKVMSEREALAAFYDATIGARWKRRDNWESFKPLGEWFGVTVDADGLVVKLELPGNGLTGLVPNSIGNLVHLREVDLSGNQIGGGVSESLGCLPRLEVLRLQENKFTAIADIGGATSLRELQLHKNEIQGPLPASIGSLAQLQVLTCQHNKISANLPDSVGNLQNLRELRLNDNLIAGPITALGNLGNLVHLNVANNQFSGNVPDFVKELGSSLVELNLSGNQFTGVLPSSFYDLAQLQIFSVQSNKITGTLNENISALERLVTFNVSQNKFSGSIPRNLCQLTALEEVHMNINGFSEDIPPEIGNLFNLQKLMLSSNALRGPIPTSITKLESLKSLFLTKNQLSGAIPPTIGNLLNLEQLYLNSNQLTGPLPDSVGNMVKLQQLYINDNKLSGGTFGAAMYGISKTKVKAALPKCYVST